MTEIIQRFCTYCRKLVSAYPLDSGGWGCEHCCQKIKEEGK